MYHNLIFAPNIRSRFIHGSCGTESHRRQTTRGKTSVTTHTGVPPGGAEAIATAHSFDYSSRPSRLLTVNFSPKRAAVYFWQKALYIGNNHDEKDNCCIGVTLLPRPVGVSGIHSGRARSPPSCRDVARHGAGTSSWSTRPTSKGGQADHER